MAFNPTIFRVMPYCKRSAAIWRILRTSCLAFGPSENNFPKVELPINTMKMSASRGWSSAENESQRYNLRLSTYLCTLCKRLPFQ
ncbi:hypothetical protein NPIL_580871 [Nephila pilipes]|uniref:Uncharacterized protein n=1 Tax=Nephila pilipes TaxID=299642 RepID=A0A8X6QJ02_NEPPI|nr:hypothetical protein NPIL_580871 [Nephila pilipes]